jgi:hypothetical protein
VTAIGESAPREAFALPSRTFAADIGFALQKKDCNIVRISWRNSIDNPRISNRCNLAIQVLEINLKRDAVSGFERVIKIEPCAFVTDIMKPTLTDDSLSSSPRSKHSNRAINLVTKASSSLTRHRQNQIVRFFRLSWPQLPPSSLQTRVYHRRCRPNQSPSKVIFGGDVRWERVPNILSIMILSRISISHETLRFPIDR